MDAQAEKMIEVYTEWLNKWHEAENTDYLINREHYNEGGDLPRILFDEKLFPGLILERRVLCLYADPYKDEGGPAILTAFFAYVDDEEGWTLDTLMQYFDTEDRVIYINGAYSPTSLPEEVK
jgi:hypothetical protein